MDRAASIQSILVRAPNWIGDQVLAYLFFHYLRKSFPQARIAVACMPWVSSIQYQDLVDEVVVLSKPGSGNVLEKFKALRLDSQRLKLKGPWDLGISLPNSLSAAWLLSWAGCVRTRGFSGDFRGWLLNDRLPWAPASTLHRADAYLQLLNGLLPQNLGQVRGADLFWGVPPEAAEIDLDPGIPGVLKNGFEPQKSWGPAHSAEIPPGDYWVLAPGSAATARKWPLEKFIALTQLIIRETGWPAVVVGGPAEAMLGKTLGELPKVLDRTAQGAVSNSWPLFKNARFTIANDSGLAHVAAICGKRTHVIWGAGDPKRTAPIGAGKVTITFNPVDCWPCERNVCAYEGAMEIQCLTGIAPGQVWEDVQRGPRRAPEND
ncbi:MAG TPA: hypothetical protein DCS07_16520 [Bdellovibrionales bacterium]|nr:MAG: hypothetical protein A2Z97_09645 [Bdellovibrionales bacterium GWB1_52_6]OFZ03658.1 MAG: hypothetical protein A2X97_01020 [Bdellovibrionales bacterium GWA1_52_35]HAR44210.1 hypothetical protein [Bdellovibrionales bacterium]HCM40617.1 hypothetical protein [Bdellovibrionales bacterium]